MTKGTFIALAVGLLSWVAVKQAGRQKQVTKPADSPQVY